MNQEKIAPVPSEMPSQGQIEQIKRQFGMFLHFGINTFGNVEWSDGTIPVSSYCPTGIDARQWVRTAKEAGMSFVILVTKHHDGFCMWNTNTTDYSVRCSGNPTDVVAKVAEACREYGMKLGLYYSLWDRNAVSYQEDFDSGYIPYMMAHLKELLDGTYGEIVELWLDGQWDKPRQAWHLDEIYDLVKRLQPGCQMGVNGTIGEDRGLAEGPEERYLPVNCKDGDPIHMFPSDFRLWDPYPCKKNDPKIYTFQGKRYYLPFEMTICVRQGHWFYKDGYENSPFMDAAQTVMDCQTAFREKNIVVVNVPPDRNGRLVDGDIAYLMEIAGQIKEK